MAIKSVSDGNSTVSTFICVKAWVIYKPAVSLALIASVLALLATAPRAQVPQLGTVDFSTSGTPQAQEHFLRGVAVLHSFWYPVALDEFRAATRIEPECMMGYWGEAMAHNHPMWGGSPGDAGGAPGPRTSHT
jgi:hypothetical protein